MIIEGLHSAGQELNRTEGIFAGWDTCIGGTFVRHLVWFSRI